MIWGIDPGLQGGIATLQDDGKFYKVVDMPTILTTINKKNKNLYDIPHLFKILAVIDSEKDLVFLEKTQPIYGVRVQASYGLGYCEGLLVGMLVAKKVRYEFFRPQAWQKYFGITKNKGDLKVQSYQIASQLFPIAELTTPRGRKLDGRSDALLIVEMGRRHILDADNERRSKSVLDGRE